MEAFLKLKEQLTEKVQILQAQFTCETGGGKQHWRQNKIVLAYYTVFANQKLDQAHSHFKNNDV